MEMQRREGTRGGLGRGCDVETSQKMLSLTPTRGDRLIDKGPGGIAMSLPVDVG